MQKILNRKFALYFLLMIVLSLVLFIPTIGKTSAKEGYTINSVKINADLQKDGSANITEVWDVDISSTTDSTEWYLIKGNLNGSAISNLKVSDETGRTFQNIGNDWDIDSSIEEKAYKCGIHKNDEQKGVELCFGIGSYGHHVFTVSYHVTQLVKGYKEQDGFNWRFVNDKMTAVPQKVSVTITAPETINDENADIWMFGNTGQINFVEKDSQQFIYAEASGSEYSSYDHHMTIVAGFNKGIFSPTKTSDKEFSKVVEKAKVGSSYSKKKSGGIYSILNALRSLLPYLAAVFSLIFLTAFAKKKGINPKLKISSKEKKDVDYYRQLPMNGDLEATYSGLDALNELSNKEKGNIISAYLLKWLNEKHISIIETESKGFLGLGKKMVKSVAFNVESLPETAGDSEKSIFNFLKAAAGGDNILQEKELSNYAEDNYKDYFRRMDNILKEGANDLLNQGIYQEKKEKSKWSDSSKYEITEAGKPKLLNILGFKKYLSDFTLLSERESKEVALWDDYLVFAALMGIADKVYDEFKKINPDYISMKQESMNTNIDFVDVLIFANTISYVSNYSAISARSAAASAGSGGMGSFGGGGGFSGGGSGGGGR